MERCTTSLVPHGADLLTLPLPSALWAAAGRKRLLELDALFLSTPCKTERTLIAERLLAESTHLHLLISEFVAQRNAYASPLLRLPTEILVQILLEAAGGAPVGRDKDIGWIRLGHVCARVRAVLLGLHALWADAVCLLPRAHAELARRAGSTPLSLILRAAARPSPQTLAFAVAHLPRARRLATNDAGAFEALLPALLSAPLPALEDAHVELWSDGFSPLPGLALGVHAYAGTPLRAPRLRSLTLINAYLPFSGGTLRVLRIVLPCAENSVRPPPAHFLDMLRACGGLETLHLDGFVPRLEEMSREKVGMARLRELSLYGAREECLGLWARLAVPRSARVLLSLDWANDTPVHLDARALATHLCAPPRGAALNLPAPSIISASALPAPAPPTSCARCDTSSSPEDQDGVITLQYRHFRGAASAFAAAVSGELGLGQAERLELGFSCGAGGGAWRASDAAEWSAVLALFARARAVRLAHAPPGLLELLRASPHNPILLPELKTLTACGAEIAGGRAGSEWARAGAGGRAGLIRQDLVSMLESRREVGRGVEGVRFCRLRLPVGLGRDEFVGEVEGVVEGVECAVREGE